MSDRETIRIRFLSVDGEAKRRRGFMTAMCGRVAYRLPKQIQRGNVRTMDRYGLIFNRVTQDKRAEFHTRIRPGDPFGIISIPVYAGDVEWVKGYLSGFRDGGAALSDLL